MNFRSMYIVAAVMLCAAFFTGCATYSQAPVIGLAYTEVSAPVAIGDGSTTGTKMGTSTVTSILGLVATGDASIRAAAKDGGITKIHYVDYESKSVLGLWSTYTVVVYGE